MASRPSLPASSTDFALPPSSAAVASSALVPSVEEFNPLLLRFRRPSLLAPPRATFYSEGRIHSPLVSSFTLPSRIVRRHTSSTISGEESESDREKMSTDSPSPSVDSGATTPLTPAIPANSAFADKDKSTLSVDSDTSMKSATSSSSDLETNSLTTARPQSPSTPPPRPSTDTEREVVHEGPSHRQIRRLSHPIKMPRILTLVAESHPEENEVKSEAQFQRFVASFSEHPMQPRTPRALSDRGRYPEDATVEEPSRDDDSSDEEDETEEPPPFSYSQPHSEPINISKSITPAQSIYGDDMGLSDSPSNMAMDIDMPSSASGSPKLTTWRYTPPPTSSSCAVRSNKRKLEDRYDPYPTANKRRAVSPSISYLRDNHNYFTPRTPSGPGRITLPHPIAIPVAPSSGASSPIVPSSLGNGSRPVSWGPTGILSSPTLRAQIGLASPVLRPMMRRREEGREVEGAGEAVGGLTLE